MHVDNKMGETGHFMTLTAAQQTAKDSHHNHYIAQTSPMMFAQSSVSVVS